MTQHTIGIDISKEHLDAYRTIDSTCHHFTNSKAGHKALITWIGATDQRIIYEPTGPYHRTLEQAPSEHGFALVKVNPRQARHFAEATGKVAKTDRMDAAMLARMGAVLELKAKPTRSQSMNELKDLHMAREALIKDRTAARNRQKNMTLSLLKRQNAERLAQIERHIKAIEQIILARIAADTDLKDRFDILVSIPGLSTITAFALLIDMPELGRLEQGQAASLAGLAPISRQSGQWTGRALIRGGRATVRQTLYMPALVAMRTIQT
jgi:transposase